MPGCIADVINLLRNSVTRRTLSLNWAAFRDNVRKIAIDGGNEKSILEHDDGDGPFAFTWRRFALSLVSLAIIGPRLFLL
jgi:hypothetical protein